MKSPWALVCCCLTVPPVTVWLLLNKTCIHFPGFQYSLRQITWFNFCSSGSFIMTITEKRFPKSANQPTSQRRSLVLGQWVSICLPCFPSLLLIFLTSVDGSLASPSVCPASVRVRWTDRELKRSFKTTTCEIEREKGRRVRSLT